MVYPDLTRQWGKSDSKLLFRPLPSFVPIVQIVAKYSAVLAVNLAGPPNDCFDALGLPLIDSSCRWL